MNLGLNKIESQLVYDALTYYFRQTKMPDLLLSMYPGADLDCVLRQLQIISDAGEDPEEFKDLWEDKKYEGH